MVNFCCSLTALRHTQSKMKLVMMSSPKKMCRMHLPMLPPQMSPHLFPCCVSVDGVVFNVLVSTTTFGFVVLVATVIGGFLMVGAGLRDVVPLHFFVVLVVVVFVVVFLVDFLSVFFVAMGKKLI